MLRPSAFAVLRLMTSSNLVGCWTGRSAGLAPFNILSTKHSRDLEDLLVARPVGHQTTGIDPGSAPRTSPESCCRWRTRECGSDAVA